jgi:hypothetical protein
MPAPYSYDLRSKAVAAVKRGEKKIENWWAVLKTWMKQRLKEFQTVRECVDAAFKNCPNVCA